MFRELIAISALVAVCLSTDIPVVPCTETTTCTIKKIDITPCKDPRKCLLKKGQSAAISFDFVPNFSATNLNTGVFYNSVAFQGMDSNACTYTTCPVEAGQQYTLNYDLMLSKKLPNGLFPVQWKVWDASNEKNECCFKATLKLIK